MHQFQVKTNDKFLRNTVIGKVVSDLVLLLNCLNSLCTGRGATAMLMLGWRLNSICVRRSRGLAWVRERFGVDLRIVESDRVDFGTGNQFHT